MSFQKIQEEICDEIRFALSKVDEKEVEIFIDNLLDAKKLFFIGVGRVMLMTKAFAKRLKHLGFDSYVVGETTVPAIQRGDLLVAASGSGETLTTINVARLAKERQARIILVTSSLDSTLKRISDVSVRVPCPTKLHLSDEIQSKQPMTNLFEQSILIFYDCVSIIIQKKVNISEEELWKIHTNLE